VEAVERARVAVRALLNERALRGSWTDWAVDIEDENRKPVVTIPFASPGGRTNPTPTRRRPGRFYCKAGGGLGPYWFRRERRALHKQNRGSCPD